MLMPRLPSPRCLDLPFTFSLSARIKSPVAYLEATGPRPHKLYCARSV